MRRPLVSGPAAMPGGPGPGPALRGSGGRDRAAPAARGLWASPGAAAPLARPAGVAAPRRARPGIVPCRWQPPAPARLLRPLGLWCQHSSAALARAVRAAEIPVFISGAC